MIRKLILFGLIVASCMPAGIKAAAEYFPQQQTKPCIFLACSSTSEFLLTHIQNMVGQAAVVKLIDPKATTAEEIARASAVLFAVNADIMLQDHLDENEFANQLSSFCDKMPWEAQGLNRLQSALFSNLKCGLIIHSRLPDEELPLSIRLNTTFGQNVFHLSQSAYALNVDAHYSSLREWLKNPKISKNQSETTFSTRVARSEKLLVIPCCDVVRKKLGIPVSPAEEAKARLINALITKKLGAMLNESNPR